MKNKKWGAIILALSFMLTAAGCGSGQGTQGNSANAPQGSKSDNKAAFVFKLGHGTSSTSLYHTGAVKFKELVEAKTNGQIKVDIYTDGTIGQDNDLINFMKTGNVQMGMIGVEPVAVIAPKLKVIGLPYIFPNRESAYKVLDGPLGAEMVSELPQQQHLRVLGYFENGFRNVSNSKREVLTPADLQGLKLRTPQSPVSISIFKALGANPTPMSFGELYTALEQKTVDGQENPLSLIYTNNFHEVQKYISITNHMYSPMLLMISEKTWSELSPELQKAVQEAANEARDYERKVSAEQEADLMKKLEEAGVKLSKPDLAPFVEATKDVHNEFDAEYGADLYKKITEATKQ
ncbi:TRAP transporter substrate-binding protein [Paenibacillus naphthalenovorans]|uniref:TRAP transporter substrate-binding protein n=1 Tax=Paenibacillus naphthalenovorans TaxID=162209 RepID=UPI003D27A9CA